MTVDLDDLQAQFAGRRYAELVMNQVHELSLDSCRSAIAGMSSELGPQMAELVSDFIDEFGRIPQADLLGIFSGDCGRALKEITRALWSAASSRNIQVSTSDLFTAFNLVTVNWAASCHATPKTMAAMQKAAGYGFFRRLFS